MLKRYWASLRSEDEIKKERLLETFVSLPVPVRAIISR